MDWNRNPIAGFEYDNGKSVRRIAIDQDGKGARRGCITIEWYTCASADGGNSWYCHRTGTSTDCTGFCGNCPGNTDPTIDYDGPGGYYEGCGGSSSGFTGAYSINYSSDPIKNRLFKLTGTVTITNGCQHAALKTYLQKAEDLEIDYRNKIRQCGIQNNVSGDALENLAAGLSFAAIAQFIMGNPQATFRTAARGLIYGQALNNLNLNACIEGAQGDINAEIDKAYNAYSSAFSAPCP